MSLSYTELKPIKVMDPRVNISESKNYLFKQGANIVTHRTFTATSASDTSISFKANPPNSQSVISRLAYLTMEFNVEVDAKTVGGDAIEMNNYLFGVSGTTKNFFAPRQFPLSSIIRTLKLELNGDSLSVEPYQYIHALGRYNLDDITRATYMSSSPSQPDCYQKYNDDLNGFIVDDIGSQGLALGEVRSPFAKYGIVGNEIPRGAYSISDVGNDGTKTTFKVQFTEPLFISPLSAGQSNLMGLSQISTLDVNLQLDSGKLNRILSVDKIGLKNSRNELNLNTFSVKATIPDGSSQKLSFIYLTPQINRPKPESLIYDYHNLQVYTTTNSKTYGGHQYPEYSTEAAEGGIPTSAAGALHKADNIQEVTSDNMSLNTIPSKIYIYGIRKTAERTAFTTDTFARITKITINFNGVSGILSAANEWELWRISVDNGLKMAYPEWQNYAGSVLCLDPSKNLGLGPQQAIGMLGNYDFSYTITLQNMNTEKVSYDLYTLVDSCGTYTISNQQCVRQVGVVSSSDVLESEDYKEMDSEYLEKLYGGNFMSGLKQIFTKAQKMKPYVKKGSKIAKELSDPVGAFAPRVGRAMKTGADVVDALIGEGYSKAEINRMKRLGYKKKDLENLLEGGNLVGGNLVGGKGMPKSKLLKRLETMNY